MDNLLQIQCGAGVWVGPSWQWYNSASCLLFAFSHLMAPLKICPTEHSSKMFIAEFHVPPQKQRNGETNFEGMEIIFFGCRWISKYSVLDVKQENGLIWSKKLELIHIRPRWGKGKERLYQNHCNTNDPLSSIHNKLNYSAEYLQETLTMWDKELPDKVVMFFWQKDASLRKIPVRAVGKVFYRFSSLYWMACYHGNESQAMKSPNLCLPTGHLISPFPLQWEMGQEPLSSGEEYIT